MAELMIVGTIMMVILGWGVPRYFQAVEQARVDLAGTNLLTIWTAQRLYWVSFATFATSIGTTAESLTLVGQKLLDADFAPGNGSDGKYDYVILAGADATSFTATATRKTGDRWSGTLSITQNASITGTITDNKVNLEPSRYALGL